jgi:hypothetical protein
VRHGAGDDIARRRICGPRVVSGHGSAGVGPHRGAALRGAAARRLTARAITRCRSSGTAGSAGPQRDPRVDAQIGAGQADHVRNQPDQRLPLRRCVVTSRIPVPGLPGLPSLRRPARPQRLTRGRGARLSRRPRCPGENCAEVAAALRDGYLAGGEAVAFFDFFANPPADLGPRTGRPKRGARRGRLTVLARARAGCCRRMSCPFGCDRRRAVSVD